MSQLNLFRFFKASSKSLQVALPSPNGLLSQEVPSTAISEANKEVEKILKNQCEDARKRRCYQGYNGKQKAAIGNYALVHVSIPKITNTLSLSFIANGLCTFPVSLWQRSISSRIGVYLSLYTEILSLRKKTVLLALLLLITSTSAG